MLSGKGILTDIQRKAIELFASLPDQEHFYLTGGTALAEFYLAHRVSFDLDFFTTEGPLVLPFSRSVEQSYRQAGWAVEVNRRFASYVELTLRLDKDEVRVDLARDTPSRFEEPKRTEYGILTNDFDDLRAEKVLAYYGRAEPRDAVDLYFLAKIESNPQQLLDLAAEKDPGFDLYWFAVALNRAESFPDELERWPVKMLQRFDPRELKSRFTTWAAELLDQLGTSPQVE